MKKFGKIKFQDKVFFTKHLATMVKAGIPILEAISSLSQQQKSSRFKKLLIEIVKEIENGSSLAGALKKHPRVFNQFYISLIEIGEESGSLEENLEYLTKQLEKDFLLRKRIRGAFLYPAVVLTAAFVVGSFMAFYILPKLVEFFGEFEIELPLSTRVLLGVATALKFHGLLIFLSMVALVVATFLLARTKFVKKIWDRLIFKLPLVGTLILYGELTMFSRSLGMLIARGVPLIRAFEVTISTINNTTFRKDLKIVRESVAEGEEIGRLMNKKRFNRYPPLVSKMISVGEKTGKLDETLIYLSEFYDDEIDSLSKNMTAILEPILLLVIGLVVGFIALAIISPIYELTGSIRR